MDPRCSFNRKFSIVIFKSHADRFGGERVRASAKEGIGKGDAIWLLYEHTEATLLVHGEV